jgi:hypothetical protein
MARDRKCGRIDQRYCGQQQHCNVLHPASFQVDESVRGVAPGKYKTFAFATTPGFDDVTDLEFMRSLESKGECVSVEENGKQMLQLSLIEIDSDSPSK